MRVLIFQAATSAAAIAAMTRFADDVRKAGHSGGLRNLAAFRREKEPADRILVALKPSEAERLKDLGAELVATFADTERIIPIQLPEEDEELEDFDFSVAVSELDEDGDSGYMTMEQLRAEAIERGIEVRADSTREELEHSLDIDQHPGLQAGDRRTDRELMRGYPADRIGFRTSATMPQLSGLDLERMNDDQLAATAAQVGVKVGKRFDRTKVINEITKTFAKKVKAPEDAAPQAPTTVDNTDLDGLDEDGLRTIAEKEEVDLGRATSVETLRTKIEEARTAKASGTDKKE